LLPDVTAWSSADWSAASGLGTLVIAGVATLIGWRQLRQARALREEEAAPFVVVDVVPSGASSIILDLVIENVGKTVARDVRITFEPPIRSATDMAGYELYEWSPLREGIKTLVPGRRLTAMFDHAPDRHASDLPRRYEVVVDCFDSRGRAQPRMAYTLDLEPLYGALRVEEKGLHHLVKEVEKLRKAVTPISQKALTVEVFDGAALQAERTERREEWRRQREGVPTLEEAVPPTPDQA
jgi:hypothetical protein